MEQIKSKIILRTINDMKDLLDKITKESLNVNGKGKGTREYPYNIVDLIRVYRDAYDSLCDIYGDFKPEIPKELINKAEQVSELLHNIYKELESQENYETQKYFASDYFRFQYILCDSINNNEKENKVVSKWYTSTGIEKQ